nr:helix-turn-helix domain-containing protein [Streptomyces sp. NRRL F-4474]
MVRCGSTGACGIHKWADRRTAAVPRGLRLQTAKRFALGEASAAVAKDLRVSVRSVQRWRRTWNEGGPRALRSQGPASLPRLSRKQFSSRRLIGVHATADTKSARDVHRSTGRPREPGWRQT